MTVKYQHRRNFKDIKLHNRLCRRIREIRMAQERSRLDVAIGADLNPNYYGRLESGKTGNMHMDTLCGIRHSLRVPWKEIFNTDLELAAFLEEINYGGNEIEYENKINN